MFKLRRPAMTGPRPPRLTRPRLPRLISTIVSSIWATVVVGLRRFVYGNPLLRRILKPVNLAQMVHGHDLKSVILALEQGRPGAGR